MDVGTRVILVCDTQKCWPMVVIKSMGNSGSCTCAYIRDGFVLQYDFPVAALVKL